MFYQIKVSKTIRQVVLIEADTEESAHNRAKDGQGTAITFPSQEVYTEIIKADKYNPDDHQEDKPEFRDLTESADPNIQNDSCSRLNPPLENIQN